MGPAELFFKFYLVEVIETFGSEVVEDEDSNSQHEDVGQKVLTHPSLP